MAVLMLQQLFTILMAAAFIPVPLKAEQLSTMGPNASENSQETREEIAVLSSFSGFARELQKLRSRLSALESRINTNVHFTASISQITVAVGDASPFKFDNVINNVGNAYNPVSGVFIAPVSGTYVFYANIMHEKSQSNQYIAWVIDKSGTVLCLNEVNGEAAYTPSSCQATTHLQRGDHVFVRRMRGQHLIHGGQWCSFTGFLLSANA